MNEKHREELMLKSEAEPFAGLLRMEAVEVGPGNARVRMRVRPELANLFGSTHGGALFSLIDEAFQLACNSHGTLAVALNVSVTYVSPPAADGLLEATATESYKTKRTASYVCEVRSADDGRLIATAQALAYRTGKDIIFGE